jgi:hypothetical protein
MDNVIIAISSFLVTGAVIVLACHIALTISQLRSRPAPEANDLQKIAAELSAHMSMPAPVSTTRLNFSGFDSPRDRF